MKEKLSAQETLQILDSQWANKQAVKKLGYVGDNKAWQIMNEIRADLEAQGYKLPRGLVPMEKVVDYFKININYLKKIKNEGS